MHCASFQGPFQESPVPAQRRSTPCRWRLPKPRRPTPAACTAPVPPPLYLQRGRHRGDLPALVHQLGLEQAEFFTIAIAAVAGIAGQVGLA